jgi:hypothetical protein
MEYKELLKICHQVKVVPPVAWKILEFLNLSDFPDNKGSVEKIPVDAAFYHPFWYSS